MSTQSAESRKKVTVRTFWEKKKKNSPITMLTAYDYSSAAILEKAGIDAILVGDSLGMVVLGYENTLSVTMNDMLHHCKAVARGAAAPLLVGDMPFLSYQADPSEALHNAGRLLAEGGMNAVKLEGGRAMAGTIERIVQAGIPVMGHIGLTPQSVHMLGGYRTQGRTAEAARRLLEDAHVLEQSGCFAVVLESVPDRVATLISQQLTIPTIGIGAGNGCDGQVLVLHDLLGLFERFQPRFVKRYAQLHEGIREACAAYATDVANRQFPGAEHTFSIDDQEWQALLNDLEENPL